MKTQILIGEYLELYNSEQYENSFLHIVSVVYFYMYLDKVRK